MRFVEFVILVVDVQHCLASETHHSRGAIVGWHPETARFGVRLEDLALLCPEGRIFRWLSFDTLYGKLSGIYPDCSAIKEFVADLRSHGQNITRSFRSAFKPYQCEFVIESVQCPFPAVLSVERLVLALQQLVKDAIDQELGARFGNDRKFLC